MEFSRFSDRMLQVTEASLRGAAVMAGRDETWVDTVLGQLTAEVTAEMHRRDVSSIQLNTSYRSATVETEPLSLEGASLKEALVLETVGATIADFSFLGAGVRLRVFALWNAAEARARALGHEPVGALEDLAEIPVSQVN